MTTITVWLLISIGYSNGEARVVERFVDLAECQRVLNAVRPISRGGMRCVQATVVR